MAPTQIIDTSSFPLSDWFFIAGAWPFLLIGTVSNSLTGVDSYQLRWGKDEEPTDLAPTAPVEPTIEEDKAAEAEGDSQDLKGARTKKANRNSYQRLSNLSDEARLSITSLSLSPERNGTDSNRSSTTIKATQVNGNGRLLSDTDFENALKKFASQRDSFLSDLTLSAGAVVPNRPKARPKTQKIVNEDAAGLKSGVGSIRRRISFRDMSSVKRQSSIKRQCW